MSKGAIPATRARASSRRLATKGRRRGTHLSPKNVCDPHLVIIHDVGKVICGQAIRFSQDKVLDRERVVMDRVVDEVMLGQAIRGALQERSQVNLIPA